MKRTILRGIAHPVTVSTAIAGLFSIAFSIFMVSLDVSEAERELRDQIAYLSLNFNSDDFPGSCNSRKFAYFYEVNEQSIDVEDRTAEDWRALRDAAAESKELKEIIDRPTLRRDLPCGIAFTPYDGNYVRVTNPFDDTGSGAAQSNFQLTFAREHDGNPLYILGQVDTDMNAQLPDQFRIRYYYANLTQEIFNITVHPDGRLTGEGRLTGAWFRSAYDTPEGGAAMPQTLGRYNTEISGDWWDTETSGKMRRNIELRLSTGRTVTALQVSAHWRIRDENGYDKIIRRSGTIHPVPLYEDMVSYRVTRYLPQTVQYELYLIDKEAIDKEVGDKKVRLLNISSSMAEGEKAPTAERGKGGEEKHTFPTPLDSGLFDIFYRLYYSIADYGPCPTAIGNKSSDEGFCIRRTVSERGHQVSRIRMGKYLEPADQWKDTRILFVEVTPNFLPWLALPLTGAVFLVVFLSIILGYTNRTRRRVNVELSATGAKLEEVNLALKRENQEKDNVIMELEKVNVTLKDYARIFLHEANPKFVELGMKIKELLGPSTSPDSEDRLKVDAIISTLHAQLKESAKILTMRLLVRDGLSQHGHNFFSLEEAIQGLVTSMKTEWPDVHYTSLLESGVDAMLQGTSSGVSEGNEPYRHVQQAVANVVQNAVDYRHQETTVIVSLQMDNEYAVLRISNIGPQVDKDKLESVFRLGTRYTGAHKESADFPHIKTENRGHLGLGLYMCAQIVDAYGGSYRMENRSDGSTGVIVTLRLPCVPAAPRE